MNTMLILPFALAVQAGLGTWAIIGAVVGFLLLMRKWIMELPDGQRVETVFIPEGRRTTICVSSQVGCSLNCSFCATAQQGFNRNLSTGEIVGQVWHAARALGEPPSNVVMMGMGEPLANRTTWPTCCPNTGSP